MKLASKPVDMPCIDYLGRDLRISLRISGVPQVQPELP